MSCLKSLIFKIHKNKYILTTLLENWFSVGYLKSYSDRMTNEYENDNLNEYDRNSEKLLKHGVELKIVL